MLEGKTRWQLVAWIAAAWASDHARAGSWKGRQIPTAGKAVAFVRETPLNLDKICKKARNRVMHGGASK
jgi:hypothetical protein